MNSGHNSAFDRVAAIYQTKAVEQEHPPRTLKDAPKALLKTLVRKAGYMNATITMKQNLQDAFDAAGLTTIPEVTADDVDRDDWIRFFIEGTADGLTSPNKLLDTEQQLERYIRNNLPSITGLKGWHLAAKPQFRLSNGDKIDLVCKHKTREYLVIELKVAEPPESLPYQMSKYLQGLRYDLDKRGEHDAPVQGLVITGQGDADMHRQVVKSCVGYHVGWKLYRRSFTLRAAPISGDEADE